jgi:fructose-1,6-bisphosphatase
MPYRHTTLSKFIIEDQRRSGAPQPDLTSLLNDIQTACKLIAVAASRGVLDSVDPSIAATQKPIATIANDIMLDTCEWGGQLRGMASLELKELYQIPPLYPRGRYLLVFNPLEGASSIDANVPVGTVFSVLRCPDGIERPGVEHFLQPGAAQVAAGYAIYGPVSMLVLTLGEGVHGFTLDREIGAYTLTHPTITIQPGTWEFAINASNQRFWEPPIRRYVDECVEGIAGPRGADFTMRWVASMVTQVHRILIRGGLFVHPFNPSVADSPNGPRLLFDANPMSMLVEQAGGAASTGRARILDILPENLDQRVPMILGSREEVERLVSYHVQHDRGEDQVFRTPLFNMRSLFTGA